MSQDQVFEALRLTESSEEARQRIVENIVATAELRFAEIVDDVLTDEQAEAFTEVVEAGNIDANISWLKENVPQVAQIYEAVIADIVAELQGQLERQ